jgi:hypothetical protein
VCGAPSRLKAGGRGSERSRCAAPTPPQARGALHHPGDPDDTCPGLDAQFVGVGLAQIVGLFDQMGRDGLPMNPRSADPALDSPRVQYARGWVPT